MRELACNDSADEALPPLYPVVDDESSEEIIKEISAARTSPLRQSFVKRDYESEQVKLTPINKFIGSKAAPKPPREIEIVQEL